ncbi:hypothetical protein G7K_3108-t1 [Saitoella complicata NRRL Y-17804]|uniref:Uncharacterized protein n=1 Tax=Saitoella complicata (strain BCRC 22490 / CBS 7301 / JCM 7358 / NBRC 10748 / NRRL Y-17804) TaxID=698492 RepID=A0A0E9NGE7_SAICN|nr:hypothetical protein G7K_3108-t1 [Saitoella complicata NRRL Y-17804]
MSEENIASAGGFVREDQQTSLPSPRRTASPPHTGAGGPRLYKLSHAQESRLIGYLDEHLLQISQKFLKKFHEGGYQSLPPLLEDLKPLLHLLEQTPTINIITQYLLQITDALTDWIHAFPPSPEDMFKMLETVDDMCVRLVKGEMGVGGRKMGTTERVRLKSIVERGRTAVILKMDPVDGWEVETSRTYEGVLEELG